MLRVVLDTNIWVSVLITSHGQYAALVREIARQDTLYASEAILEEVRDVVLRPRILKKYHLSETVVDQALLAIRGLVALVSDLPTLIVVPDDPDDNKILACAVKARADYLVSYDPHLTALGDYEGIQILTPRQFRSVLKG